MIRTRNQKRAAAVVGGEALPDEPGKPMSRESKIREIERLLKDESLSATDRLRAIEQHNRMTAGDAGPSKLGIHKIDPADLVEYLRVAAEQGIDMATLGPAVPGTGGSGVDPAERFGSVSEAGGAPDTQPVGGAA